jgi:hypothetical protein
MKRSCLPAPPLSDLYLFSDVAVHLEVIVLVVIALVGAFVQVFHQYSRRRLRLQQIPGTIASAISIGAETNLAQLLNGQQEQNFGQALRDKQFHIDPQTMKIVMEGDDGYEEAVSPNPRQLNSPSWSLHGSSETRTVFSQ